MEKSPFSNKNKKPKTKTPESEMEQIRKDQQKEREWWENFSSIRSIDDIKEAIEEGKAERVPDEGEFYKISENVPDKFRVLNKNAKSFLKKLSKEWNKELESKLEEDNEHFLVISSLARTVSYQKELQEGEYPAVEGEKSTHTKLGAFDVATKWFKNNAPEALEALDESIESLQEDEVFNCIEEPTIGAYHIALPPQEVNG